MIESLGWSALIISSVMLIRTSKLNLAIFLYLATWAILDEVLIANDSFLIYFSLVLGMGLNALLILSIWSFDIKSTFTHWLIGFDMVFMWIILLSRPFGLDTFYDVYYIPVAGLVAFLCTLEGGFDGIFRSRQRRISDFSWLSNAVLWGKSIYRNYKGTV